MMKVRLLISAVLVLGVWIAPSFAHHTVALTHDTSNIVTIRGTVERVSWMNPHVWIELRVKNANGDVAAQRVEIAGPGRLIKTGFGQNFLTIGDLVTLDAWMPKDGVRFKGLAPNGRTLTLPDGRRFDVADQWPTR